MKERTFAAQEYTYGFNGQEQDGELMDGAVVFKYRIHDPRIGKFLSVDPLAPEYPWNSAYAFAENQVIWAIDLEGAEAETVTKKENELILAKERKFKRAIVALVIVDARDAETTNVVVFYHARGGGIANSAYDYYTTGIRHGIESKVAFHAAETNPTTYKNSWATTVYKNSYVSKRFILHYQFAKGGEYRMNEEEMKASAITYITPYSSPLRKDGKPLKNTASNTVKFNKIMSGLKVGESKEDFEMSVSTGAMTSGTLGQFHLSVKGTLTKIDETNWTFSGTIVVDDTYDFDSHDDNDNSGRGATGEFMTWVGRTFLTGEAFRVSSEAVNVTADSRVNKGILDFFISNGTARQPLDTSDIKPAATDTDF